MKLEVQRENDSSYHVEFLVRLLNIGGHIFNIIVNPVQHCALIDHHALKILEDVGEFNDALRYVVNLSLALSNSNIIRVEALKSLRSLLESRLRERFVGLGFHHRWVIVRI